MAPVRTNYSEIQNDEIEALRSIYMEDFVEEEAKTGAWNKVNDRAFTISLKAAQAEEERHLTLHVSFPQTYPKSLPRLTLSVDPYLRQKSRLQAERIIESKPQAMLGSEMIFEIATSLQDTLENDWIDPKSVPTLDEERAAQEEAARIRKFQLEEAERERASQARSEEAQFLQELIKQRESRFAKSDVRSGDAALGDATEGELPEGSLRFERSVSIRKPISGKPITVDTVFRKNPYRLGQVCNVYTCLPQENAEQEYTLEIPYLIIKETSFSSKGIDSSIKRTVQNLEAKLETHMGLSPHSSIAKPLNFRIDSTYEESSSRGWTVTILMELASSQSLRETLDIVPELPINVVRAWSVRLLEGLQYYHRHGLVHASLHLNNILLEKDRETERRDGNIIIPKLSDGGYQRDLHLLKTGSIPQRQSVAWTAPELVSTQINTVPATDIWDFGVCFLQMAFGLGVSQYQSPHALLEELVLTKSSRALLTHIFSKDPKKRPTAWELLHFEFFRNDDALIEGRQPGLIKLGDANASGPISLSLRPRRISEHAPSSASRYAKEFVEDGRLGRGGFGEVFRARNKIDSQPYAIKKVKAKSRSALDPVLSEVTVLSRLNHPNVVRYFAAWIEDEIMGDTHESESSDDYYTSSTTGVGQRPSLPLSSRGLDFISSSNAEALLANEDDDESSSDEEEIDGIDQDSDNGESSESSNDTDTRPIHEATAATALGIPTRATQTILYIQMEYCKQETLRDVINSDLQDNGTEGWRLFRQIVQGLTHIHAMSIVHRDLKPENIFIDSQGDVRIGDFGLARPGDYQTPINLVHKEPKEAFGGFTMDIGTATYVAPEVRSAGTGKYNEKADMYSLGVILLEMNVAFSTGMERAETLALLQRDGAALPSGLKMPEKAAQAKIFLSLVQSEPSLRPSSLDLLDSGQIPVQDEDELLRMAQRLLTNPKSRFRSQFIRNLFTADFGVDMPYSSPMQAIALLEDVKAMSQPQTHDLGMQALVKQKLSSIFRRHGAVERTDSPALFPYHPCYPALDVVQLLHSNEKILQLPYDLILPNAMLLAHQIRPEPKTFIFDNVYRADHSNERPKIFGEANFDIVTESTSNLALYEAEVIKVINEVVDTFPNLASAQMCYHINHSHLLDVILRFCDVESSKWPAIKETMSKLHTGDWTWIKVRHELRGPSIAVASISLDELERFDFRDSSEKAISRLRNILKGSADLESTFAHMQAVISYLDRLHVKRKIYISPLSSYNEKFYRGNLLFQCVYDYKKRSVLAAGGRYDHLIRDHQPTAIRKTHVHAVGFQIAWTGLCTEMTNYLKKAAKARAKKRSQGLLESAWVTRRCDVLVDSFDPELLDSVGIEILQELWAQNISAELAETHIGGTMDHTFLKKPEHTKSHSWIIQIKTADWAKVRCTTRNDEVEVRITELASHLRSELRDRARGEGVATRGPLHRYGSQQEAATAEKERDVDIKVLTSQNKGKKVNRKTIVEEAQHHKQLYLEACVDGPIIAIETKDDIFEGIGETRLNDAESWRKFIQNAAPGERQYLGQLHNMLKTTLKEATQNNASAIIYNFRTKGCILYNLGKVT